MSTRLSALGHDVTPISEDRRRELAADLTEDEARVILEHGTERSGCGTLLDNTRDGTYVCRLCGLPLFSSEAKFDSGTGWPSFVQAVDETHITFIEDTSHGMQRVEIRCARCDAHLGHVFPDGPPPTGHRYCLNSVAMTFLDVGDRVPERSRPAIETSTAYFAGGCFWGVEDRFQHLDGVIDAASGYQGGHTDNPTYRDVCDGGTGHAEAVRVIFDPSVITYRELLEAFFAMHNPTMRNRQGPDVGSQYRSAIFTNDDTQREEAEAYIRHLTEQGAFGGKPIVTEVRDAPTFYLAEPHHQDYNARHGRRCGI